MIRRKLKSAPHLMPQSHIQQSSKSGPYDTILEEIPKDIFSYKGDLKNLR